MKKTMKEMDDTLDVTQLVKSAFMTDHPDHPLIGAIVKFKVTDDNRIRLGTAACTYKYEVIGTQRCWGYDAQGRYTMVDGFRLICLDYEDRFGRAATADEFVVLTTLN